MCEIDEQKKVRFEYSQTLAFKKLKAGKTAILDIVKETHL